MMHQIIGGERKDSSAAIPTGDFLDLNAEMF
jgi:hypothetical protein